MAQRGGTDRRTDEQTYKRKFSPFYRTLSPIGAAAQKEKEEEEEKEEDEEKVEEKDEEKDEKEDKKEYEEKTPHLLQYW